MMMMSAKYKSILWRKSDAENIHLHLSLLLGRRGKDREREITCILQSKKKHAVSQTFCCEKKKKESVEFPTGLLNLLLQLQL